MTVVQLLSEWTADTSFLSWDFGLVSQDAINCTFASGDSMDACDSLYVLFGAFGTIWFLPMVSQCSCSDLGSALTFVWRSRECFERHKRVVFVAHV